VTQFTSQNNDAARAAWLDAQFRDRLSGIGRLRGDCNVLLFGSAFLQKPHVPQPFVSLSPEDVDGLMATLHGMDWDKPLALILHTPGGVTNAAETVVAYIRSKFQRLEVIVPTFAMSAGTMIALAADTIVMGRQSQLGPIDPQMSIGGRMISARAVVEQFERAKRDIVGDPDEGTKGDLLMAHVWAPVLATIGPALLQEAQNALEYSERIVSEWLATYMFHDRADAIEHAKKVAAYFNDASRHLSHGRRIDRNECRLPELELVIEDLEDNQSLQEEVLTLYHLMTIAFQNGPATKLLRGTSNVQWLKQWMSPEEQAALAQRATGDGGPGIGPTAPSPPRARPVLNPNSTVRPPKRRRH